MCGPAAQLKINRQVEYRALNGEPLGETDIHIDEMMEARQALKKRYRDEPRVYVAGNLPIFYEEGNPSARVAPDVFVVFGVPKQPRRSYKLWEERRPPSFVLEVTSRATRLDDRGNKRVQCEELGVFEYFLFDPEADYLDPPLQGFRLRGETYELIEGDDEGNLASQVLGLGLQRDDEGRLRFFEPATGQRLLRIEEHIARAETEAARASAAEAEIVRLRARLETK